MRKRAAPKGSFALNRLRNETRRFPLNFPSDKVVVAAGGGSYELPQEAAGKLICPRPAPPGDAGRGQR